MAWPEATDYNEAIQNPAVCFADPDLRQGRPEVNAMGWPLPCSGNFAAVYKVFGPDQTAWAVKCFTRAVAGLRERYHAISAHLQQAKLPFAVDFQYLEQGIRIRGDWFAVVKMRWVEGFTLNEFLKNHADKPQILERLAGMWLKLARELRRAGIAHADLQHGNVLLVPGGKSGVLSVRLIDYDGMFVPALAQRQSGEVGHANYQHPERARKGIYDAEVDRFPHLVIYTTLRTLLTGGRALWEKHDNGENLLFREPDFLDPGNSALLRELWQLPDPHVRSLIGHVVLAARKPIAEVPLLADLVSSAENGEVVSLSAAQEAEMRSLLGEPGGQARKPKTSTVTSKPTSVPVSAVAPSTAAPIPLVPDKPAPPVAQVEPKRRRRRKKTAVAARRRLLLVAGGGFASILLLGAILLLLIAGGGERRPEPDDPGIVVVSATGNPGEPNLQSPDTRATPQPRISPLADVTLFPGDEQTVVVKVERRGYKGPIELHIRDNSGSLPRAVITPTPLPGIPGKVATPSSAELRVEQKLAIPPERDAAKIRVVASEQTTPGRRAFELTAMIETVPGEPLVPLEEESSGKALPKPVGKDASPNRLVRRFLVTVRPAPRSNPKVLAVANNVGGPNPAMQIDVVHGGVLAYDYRPMKGQILMRSSPGAPAGLAIPGASLPRHTTGEPAEVLWPSRLVVVSASFPYKQQLEECRKALRLASVAEFLARPDIRPHFAGLNVQRREVRPDGTRSEWIDLYHVAEDGRVTVQTQTARLLAEAVFETRMTEALAAVSFVGLVTPLPRLASAGDSSDARPVVVPGGGSGQLPVPATGAYPPLKLQGITSSEGSGNKPMSHPGGAGPMAPLNPGMNVPRGTRVGPGDTGVDEPRLAFQALTGLPSAFKERLQGRGFAFHPYGLPLGSGGDPANARPGPLGMPPLPPGLTGMPGESIPGRPLADNTPEHGLVRFFDADIQPGKTYEYSIQVCMANPNYGKKDLVRTAEEARDPHLHSPIVITPPVTVPGDFHFYIVDQHPLVTRVKGFKTIHRERPIPAGKVPVQIYLWLPELPPQGNQPHKVGGWVVAERLLLGRGELIGRPALEVEVPVWNVARGSYVLGTTTRIGKGRTRKAITKWGTPVDFDLDGAAPVLADFREGLLNEGSFEALVLSADGTLTVRNSRSDSSPNNPTGYERLQRYAAWQAWLDELRTSNQPSAPVPGIRTGPRKRSPFDR